jgi:hypothetical protein
MKKTNDPYKKLKISAEYRAKLKAEADERKAARALRYDIPETGLYNAALFRKAKAAKPGPFGYPIRAIAEETGLTVNSVQTALKGEKVLLETLWKLSRFFEIEWHSLFNITTPPLTMLKAKPKVSAKKDWPEFFGQQKPKGK